VGDRRTMSRKCVRKFMVAGMMELLIVIHFLQVQAFSFSPSSLGTPWLSHFSKLDGVVEGPFAICIRNRTEKCKAWLKIRNEGIRVFAYNWCIGMIFVLCHGDGDIKALEDPIYPTIKRCVRDCFEKHKKRSPAVTCLLECYEEHGNANKKP
jgi:hypothetical protein